MHNPLDMAFVQITTSIPPQLLRAAFPPQAKPGFEIPVPMHEQIKTKVIYGRVAKECKLMGGTVRSIPLKRTYMETTLPTHLRNVGDQEEFSIYRIPPEAREGREIAEVMDVLPAGTFTDGGYKPYTAGGSGGTALAAASIALDSHTGASYVPRPKGEVLAGDLVRISPANFLHSDWILSVRLAYDDAFTNMHTSAIMPFCELVVAATKAHIYNNLILEIDRVAMDGGSINQRLISVIESYEPEEERYKMLLEEFHGSSLLNPRRLAKILSKRL